MKQYIISKRNYYSIFTLLLFGLLFISCGTYQSAYTNDGIYDDAPVQERVVVVETRKEVTNADNNYFSRELEKLDNSLDREAIFTDIDKYSSYDNNDTDYEDYSDENNEPWGYTSGDNVIVQINYRDHWSWNNWNWNNWDFYGNRNYWRHRWGFRHGFYGNYVYQPFYYGYYRNNFHYGFYYNPNYYMPNYRNRRYNRYFNNNNARNYTYNKRNILSRRSIPYSRSKRSNSYARRDATSINESVRSDYRNRNYKSTRRSNNAATNKKTNARRRSTTTQSSNKRRAVAPKRTSSTRMKRSTSNSSRSYKSSSSRRSYQPARSSRASRSTASRSRSSRSARRN